MADICKCSFSQCPLFSTCFRFLAKESQYQAYFVLTDEDKEKIKKTGKCSEYWECKTPQDLKKFNDYWWEP